MGKKCPVGLICIDTKYLLLFFLLIIVFYIYHIYYNNSTSYKSYIYKKPKISLNKTPKISVYNKNKSNDIILKTNKKSNMFNNLYNDSNSYIENDNENHNDKDINIIINQPPNKTSYLVNKDYERISNPLLPPERRNNYIDPHSHVAVSPGVPINIPTRGFGGSVQQIGMLTKQGGNNPIVLPLFGCPTYANSNKWMYYTSSDKYNQVKIPLTNKNRQCDIEYGCEELYDGDSIPVYPYEGDFKVSIYKYDKPRYLPHII